MAGLAAAMTCTSNTYGVRSALRRRCRRGGGRVRGRRGLVDAFGRLFLGQPLFELGLRHGLDDDRHEAVVLAAELGALAAIDARRRDLGPGRVDDSGDRVLLPAE